MVKETETFLEKKTELYTSKILDECSFVKLCHTIIAELLSYCCICMEINTYIFTSHEVNLLHL